MFEFVKRSTQFLTAMDARTVTSLGVSIILLVFVCVMFFFGQEWMQLRSDDAIDDIINKAALSPLALFGVISVFSLLALTGFPQILMIAATIGVFGVVQGAFYAWIATMTSATLTFGFGHFLGGRWVRKFGGDRVHATINFLSRHGVLASGLIRVVPSAPFIVVNSAAGAAHIPLWKYWLGTGIGIVPKIALVAVLAAVAPDAANMKEGISGLVAFFQSREMGDLLLMGLIIPVWLAFLFVMRRLYLHLRRKDIAG